jgi:hypothetical protein
MDGLVKDAGVCMEIGYAFGRDLPVGVLSTSFIWSGVTDTTIDWPLDPILSRMASVKIFAYTMPAGEKYQEANEQLESGAVRRFVLACLDRLKSPVSQRQPNQSARNSVYVDFGGASLPWAAEAQESCCRILSERRVRATGARRFLPDSLKSVESIRRAAAADMASASSAQILIVSSDCALTDPGTAALLGLGKARGARLILHSSNAVWYMGVGQQQMRANLMLDQAAHRVAKTVAEAADIAATYARSLNA